MAVKLNVTSLIVCDVVQGITLRCMLYGLVAWYVLCAISADCAILIRRCSFITFDTAYQAQLQVGDTWLQVTSIRNYRIIRASN
jgi:hypothetical protein